MKPLKKLSQFIKQNDREMTKKQKNLPALEWQEIFDAITDIVFIQSEDFTIIKANKALLEALKTQPEDIVGKKCHEVFHKANEPWGNCPFKQTKRDKKPHMEEVDDPNIGMPLLITTSPIFDNNGKLTGSVHIAKDLTERRKAEQMVHDSENRFRSLVSNIPGAVYRCANDSDWSMKYLSDTIKDISGYPSSDFINNKVRSYASIIHPKDRILVDTAIHKGVSQKEPFIIEYRIIHANGEVHWVYEKGQGVFDDKGNALWLDGAIFDITEQEQADEELRRITKAIESSNEAIGMSDSHGNHVYQNRAFSNLFEYSVKELAAGGGGPLVYADKEIAQNIFRTIMTGGTWAGEVDMLSKSGRKFPVALRADAVKDDSGEIIGLIGIHTDITKAKQAETEKAKLQAQLFQSQKMETIGSLAGGIAHDFNNLLTSIISNTDFAMDDIPKESQAYESLNDALTVSRRAKELIAQILAFSRRSDAKRDPVIIYDLIKDALKILRPTVDLNIIIKENIDTGINKIMGDPAQIYQVIMNLLTNAFHAMEKKGGILEIHFTREYIDENKIIDGVRLKEDHYLKLSVIDTGMGMSNETKKRIFDPFYTTKEIGKGTGLGLSVAYGIIKNHNGYIFASSQLNKGTTFDIYLPLTDQVDEAD